MHKRPHLLNSIALAVMLTLMGGYLLKTSHTSALETAATHTSQPKADHIIVQLFQVPGFIYPSINGVPEWTLYDDGLLFFKPANGLDLVQAHLSPANINAILNVVINQNAFFASTKDTYGRLIPDAGSLLLSVTINGHHKQVTLYGKPDTALDEQTRHVFAIRDFLLNYHPATTRPYTPPGVALLVIPQDGNATGVPMWPYKDISLAQTAALECPFLPFGTRNCSSNSKDKAGIVPVFGSRGQALLLRAHDNAYARMKEQGKIYRLIIWPLLPDAFYPHNNGTFGIAVEGVNSGIWPLLSRTHGSK
ncbi:MAG: hypothetical protein H0V70_16990 [Ktedonobacteraceae bacterium]|nr:hypothetical protein [Ktedonobacteraceae bacterium]